MGARTQKIQGKQRTSHSKHLSHRQERKWSHKLIVWKKGKSGQGGEPHIRASDTGRGSGGLSLFPNPQPLHSEWQPGDGCVERGARAAGALGGAQWGVWVASGQAWPRPFPAL